jgi:hypothetical protein
LTFEYEISSAAVSTLSSLGPLHLRVCTNSALISLWSGEKISAKAFNCAVIIIFLKLGDIKSATEYANILLSYFGEVTHSTSIQVEK